MPTRRVKTYSDRGSIRDLGKTKPQEEEIPTPAELRLKRLYEYAQVHRDSQLLSALGFITTDYISDKNALPLSIYRIRQIIGDIKKKSGSKIDELAQEFAVHFQNPHQDVINIFLGLRSLEKIASPRKPPVFRRVSKS